MNLPQKFYTKLLIVCLICMGLNSVFAGQTGKITGTVIDAETREPLIGVNLTLEGTTIGAASDLDGEFIILNVAPGRYSVVASMIGYQKMRVTGIKISVDLTTEVNFALASSVLEMGESVTIVAERPLIQKDLTATAASVSGEEIAMMPVESFQDILQLQAGIVQDSQGDLHIRGGRSSEIAYMVDGVSVSDPFSGKMSVNVDHSSIQEMKVISGTFNAEYGQVMSGIVEIVTKDPADRLAVGGSFYCGDYLSSHEKIFMNIGEVAPLAIHNTQFYLSGPAPFWGDKLSTFISFREFNNDGWMYGQRRYLPADSSNFQNPDAIYQERSGDNTYLSMNSNQQYFVNAKVVYKPAPGMKFSYNFLGDLSDYRNYDHLFKYNPEGDVTKHQYAFTNILNLNHTLSPTTFYTLKLSHNYLNHESYLYEDPADSRYVNPVLLRNVEDAYSFLTGGTNMSHYYRETSVDFARFDVTSQMTKIHQVKAGIEFKYNTLFLKSFPAQYQGEEGGGIFSADAFFNSGEYTQHPTEWMAYVQDKIELKSMTLNLGLRYDYFNSQGEVPVDLRDPNNSIKVRDSGFAAAVVKHQVSPRFGFAFPTSASGVVHVSYGHFFQIPPYEYLYLNPRFAVAPGGLSTRMGNANLNPQTTIIYEIGFQQEFLGQIGLDVTGFYKDARDLLGARIYESYVLGDRYARYENRDYGNIRGITFSLNKRATRTDNLAVSFDYSFQVSEGNASDPNHEFYNNQATPPKKSNVQVIPLDWDQRHTVNFSLVYQHPRFIGVGIIGQFQSGLPFTPTIQNYETTFENSSRKPFNYNVDLRLFRQVKLGGLTYHFFVKVYNLLDRQNELNVYADTGRASYSLVSQYIGARRGYVNSLDEWLIRPDYYSEPRKLLVGFEVELN
jgi:outer membrane receptor for ferrienterochelin and colicin